MIENRPPTNEIRRKGGGENEEQGNGAHRPTTAT